MLRRRTTNLHSETDSSTRAGLFDAPIPSRSLIYCEYLENINLALMQR